MKMTTTYPPHSLLLEDAKGLPVFWSGTEAVAKLVWRLTPSDTHKLERMTVSEVLEKFSAQDYIKNCVVSHVVSSQHKTTHPCHMSDNFSSLWGINNGGCGRGVTVKLVLDSSYAEIPREISSKYLLILAEMSKKRIFWDGRRPVSNLIFRVNESQMLTTVDTTLRKFMALNYLRSRKIKLELVVAKREERKTSGVKGDDILGSLFTGTSASLRVSMKSTIIPKQPQPLQNTVIFGEEAGAQIVSKKSDIFHPTTTTTEETGVVSDHSLESFWLDGNWSEIRERVQYQIEALDSLRREREIPTEFDEALAEEKQLLESSLRRRSRSVEQVWRHYEQLKARVASGMGSFPYKSGELSDGPTPSTPVLLPLEDPSPPSDSVERLNPHGPMDLSQTTTSCLEVVASTLRTLGVEILDEDQRVSPVAGVALTVVLVLTICILSHCVT
ncbi:uncharacterized protein LOC110845206 [Folsomia candida]|uniref:uncharacterized protein LOC110845206 n=1 Tax=Folsomia candida TaxID=158441 RepID=UPI001605568F|nr:uncharacterized protein LOC110845206 [Folsomia candida]